MTTTSNDWHIAVRHATQLGAISRDANYFFNPEKTAMIIDNNYIKCSSVTAKSLNVEPTKISLGEFLEFRSLHDANNIGQVVPDYSSYIEAMEVAQDVTSPIAMDNLVVTDVEILEQNALMFKTVGIDKLQELGLDVTMMDGVPYILDVANNTATELTTQYVAEQAKVDFLNGDTTEFTMFAKEFQLINKMVFSKVVEA